MIPVAAVQIFSWIYPFFPLHILDTFSSHSLQLLLCINTLPSMILHLSIGDSEGLRICVFLFASSPLRRHMFTNYKVYVLAQILNI